MSPSLQHTAFNISHDTQNGRLLIDVSRIGSTTRPLEYVSLQVLDEQLGVEDCGQDIFCAGCSVGNTEWWWTLEVGNTTRLRVVSICGVVRSICIEWGLYECYWGLLTISAAWTGEAYGGKSGTGEKLK